jgi:lysophospholipase L1-like esterase
VSPSQLAGLFAGIAVLALAVILVWSIFGRRIRRGGQRIAGTLHLNARWWRERGTKKGDLLYLAIGDSAAQGVGASHPGRGYVGILARHIRDRTGKTVRVVNLSVSGARLQDAIATQLPHVHEYSPDILTVAIGANDMNSFDAEKFEGRFRRLLHALPDGVIVADIPSFYVGAAERNAVVASEIVHRLAATRGFEVAELHNATRRQGVARYAFNQTAADFFHPNDRGYRVWAAAFIPVLDRVLPTLSVNRDGVVPGSDGGSA